MKKRKSYPITHYRSIFRAMEDSFGVEWAKSIPGEQYNAWQRQIRANIFDAGITPEEVISVIIEVDKRQWPQGTGFFSRVRDLCLLHRKHQEKSIRIDSGPTKISFDHLSTLTKRQE